MPCAKLPPAVLELVAERFRVLAEPARLQVLGVLRDREATVTELAAETGLAQPNLSRHLQLLHGAGFVRRRKDGAFTYYALADAGVLELCDLVCGRLEAELEARREVLASR